MSLTADCLAQLKLRQAPFEAIPSEEFLYSDPLLESLIETAARALTAPGAVVILAGASGSGRSIQLMRLLGAVGDHFELIAFRGRHNIPFEAVDVTIRSHLRASGFDDPRRPLHELLIERNRTGAPIVLAIDDAHLLGVEIVDRLLRLRAEVLEARGQGMRLILVGDQALSRGRLPLPDPTDELQVVRLNLRPFNPEQAGAYLRHRLRVAGVEDPDAFLTPGDIAALQTNSQGIPAALNANANALLARRCRSAGGFKQTIADRIGNLVKPAAVAAAPVAEATPLAPTETAVEQPTHFLAPDVEDEVFRPTMPHLADYLVQNDANSETYDFEQVLRHVRNSKLILEPEPEPEPALVPDSAPQPEPAANKPTPVPIWNQRWFMPSIIVVVVLAILVPVVWQLMDDSPPSVPDLADIIVPQEPPPPPPPPPVPPVPVAQPVPPVAPPVETTSEPPVETPPAPVAIAPVAPVVPKPQPAPPPPPPPPPSPQPEVYDPAEDQSWLMRQDPARYTIQLIAARDPATTRAFVARYNLSGIRYIQTRSFLIAVIGSFPNRTEAERALPDLPASVRAKEPWIRTIGSVRQSQ